MTLEIPLLLIPTLPKENTILEEKQTKGIPGLFSQFHKVEGPSL
jgi:hypothetical protein